MSNVYSLEEKIANVRRVVRNLTGKEERIGLLKEIDSNSSRVSQNSLENYLEAKFEAESKQSLNPHAGKHHTFDYGKIENQFKDSFENSYIKTNQTGLLSSQIYSFKPSESELNALLELERTNIKKLEQRILQKDEIIDAMNKRQKALKDELATLKLTKNQTEIQEYKETIRNLQEKLEKHTDQSSFLQKTHRPTPDFKKSSLEEDLQNKIISLESQLTDQSALLQKIHSKDQKLKQDRILISDLKNQIEKKDQTISELLNLKHNLSDKTNETDFKKIKEVNDFREIRLKEEVNRLKQVNDDLFAKFKKIGSIRFSQTYHRDRSAGLLTRDLSTDGICDSDTEKKSKFEFSSHRLCSSQSALTKITESLKCTKSEILPRLKTLKRSEKLEKQLRTLIQDLSGQKNGLSATQIWKCITKLIEEYIVIKKNYENCGGLKKIAKLLGVSETEVFGQVKKNVEEQKRVNGIVGKIKKMLSLSPRAGLQEVEHTLGNNF